MKSILLKFAQPRFGGLSLMTFAIVISVAHNPLPLMIVGPLVMIGISALEHHLTRGGGQ